MTIKERIIRFNLSGKIEKALLFLAENLAGGSSNIYDDKKEQEIGVYFGKPLFRKVIRKKNLDGGYFEEIDGYEQNLRLVNSKLSLYFNDGGNMTVKEYTGDDIVVQNNRDTGFLAIFGDANHDGGEFELVIEYTKLSGKG